MLFYMNAAPSINPPRRRLWLWILGLCLAPLVVFGAVAISVLSLDRDAAVLRNHVMAGTHANWQTRIQLSVGGITFGLVRAGLSFAKDNDPDIEDALLALKAVNGASVGIYERGSSKDGLGSTAQLLTDTDKAMTRRGWSRLVGVVDKKEAVIVYVPVRCDTDGPIDICLAVINGRELVVVSATVDATGLAELVEKHAGAELKRGLKLAQF